MTSTVLPEDVQRNNTFRLTIATALAGANSVVVYATAAIVGHVLAPSKALATLPISIFVVGMAACTLPAGVIARRHGRRAAFLAGTTCGVLIGLISAVAVVQGSFPIFCVATFFGGAYAAVVLSFRFAAADGVEASMRPRALSFVMGGGVVAGVVGPQLVTFTMDLWPPHMFAVTYLAQAAVAAISAIVLSGVHLPKPIAAGSSRGRPLSEIVRQPLFVTAVACGAISYMVMNFLMTAAPLAMKLCGHPQRASNLGLQWHVIAMYAPSFFTGRLITRFGAGRVVTAGLLLIAVSAAAGLTGIEVSHFWVTLVILGIGWNFGFVGASALVLECHRPEERTRVQSLNDFIVFGTMAVGSFASGSLLAAYDWATVLQVSFAPVALALVILASTASRRPRASTTLKGKDA
jgi:MFS family permease